MYDLVPIEIAASGMTANRIRMGVIASNLANASSTRSAEGTGPYQRRMVRFRAAPQAAFQEMLLEASRTARGREITFEPRKSGYLAELHLRGVEVAGIDKDPSVRKVYDPTHKDADPVTGEVTYPNISVIEEMTDMIMASRNYEANLAVIKNTRDMIMQMVELLRS